MVNPVESFEGLIVEYLNVPEAIGVCNGSAALYTAFNAIGLKEGDHVVTTPFTFIASTNAILQAKGVPVFADIHSGSYCLDPALVEKMVINDPKVTAILGVDIFGNLHGVEELQRIAAEYDVNYIEDASQAFGATRNGRHAGTYGTAGTFSFYPSKNLWTFEAGMIVTGRADIAENARIIRNHGLVDGVPIRMGWNYKMSWLSAFIAETNLRLHKPGILAELGRYGISDGYYPRVVYDNPFYKKLSIQGDCPVAEKIAKQVREMKK